MKERDKSPALRNLTIWEKNHRPETNTCPMETDAKEKTPAVEAAREGGGRE